MADEFSVKDRQELAQMVGDLSDDQLRAAVGESVDTVLDQVFEGMRDAFVPERAAGQSAVVQWDIDTPQGSRSYQFRVEGGVASCARGAPDAPRVVLGLGLPDFLRLVSGRLDGMQAFMAGKLRLSGDLLLAQAVQSWFAV